MRIVVIALVLVFAGCGGTQLPLDGADMTPTSDAGSDGGLKPFGAMCASGSECESGICFIGGNRSFCSLRCTPATQAADCPKPPTSGTCNMQGYCKP